MSYEKSLHVFSDLLSLFHVESYLSTILGISDISGFRLTSSVRSYVSINSFGRSNNDENDGFFFSAVSLSIFYPL